MKNKYLLTFLILLTIINILTLIYFFCECIHINSSNIFQWKDVFSILKDVVLILVPIITVIIAIKGINKWKSEFKGKANFEASYKLLKSVYQVRDNFATLRNSFIMANEMLPNRDIPDYESENMRHVIKSRINPHNESYNNFNSILPEIEALFGKDIKQTCMEVNRVIFKYHMSLNQYFQLLNRTNNTPHFEKLSKDVFSQSDEDDELQKQLNTIIENIETELSKHIKMN